MILIMTLLVRNEEDVICENIEYHLSQGVDFFIVTDHLSEDRTTDILYNYERQGYIELISASGPYIQTDLVTKMAEIAFSKYKADWIINNDADEFWYYKNGKLKDAFINVPSDINIIRAKRHNMLLPKNGVKNDFYQEMIFRRKKSLNPIGANLPSKVCVRGANNVVIHPGSHKITHPDGNEVFNSEIEIFHYPFRSYEQFQRKIRTIGDEYEKNPQVDPKTGKEPGNTLKTLYKNKENAIKKYSRYITVDEKMVLSSIFTFNPIVKDRRLANMLRKVME